MILFIGDNFEEFIIESQYIKSANLVTIKHIICNHSFKRKPDQIYQNGLHCPKCYKDKPSHLRKSPEQYEQEFINMYGNSLSLKSDYVHGHVKLNVECPEGHSWWSDPFYLLKGKGCPTCNKKNFVSPLKKSHEQFVIGMFNKFGDEYTILGEYELYNKPVFTRHNPCGHEWYPIASNLYSDGSCPICKQSKGEKVIRNYLSDNNYTFEEQFTFEDCRGEKYSLRFDFCVRKNNSIWLLVEYDGEFHFQENRMYKDEITRKQKFKELQERDETKNEYCKANSIPLLRIPYWQKNNVQTILNNFISELKRKELVECLQ